MRLDNFGNPSSIAAGNAAQSPKFNKMSAHYVEFAPNKYTQLGQGYIAYHAPETDAGGSTAIDFNKCNPVGNNEIFLSIPFSSIPKGTYQYLRVSLAYQNYDVKFKFAGNNYKGTVASFIGYNTYIQQYKIKDSTVTINGNRLQGYWGFETFYKVIQGQAPATTVVNPIADTSPIPSGSCVVTAAFSTPFVVTGNETSDKTIIVSLSTNKSFEWKEINFDNLWEPAIGENVVDMGIRGMLLQIE
ncbi:MAG: hypothetical protein RML38_10110 [Bacteroidia bacterium]|nr:hypothetical protein [Bacteroidia bacterium]